MTTLYVILPSSEKATLDGYASEVDAALGLPRCNCASCAAARGAACPCIGRCVDCKGAPKIGQCVTYAKAGSDPMHGIAMTNTYAEVQISADGTKAAYIYDESTRPIVGSAASASAAPLPADWQPVVGPMP